MEKQLARDAFFQYHFLSRVAYAPNGKHIAYVCTKSDPEHNTYRNDLQVIDHSKTRCMTVDGSVQTYLWDDSNTLLFSALRDEDDKAKHAAGEECTSFYRISLKGGEAKRAFTIPLQVTHMTKVKKGVYAFTALYDLNYSHMYACKEKEKNAILKQKKDAQDYEVFDELPYYFNGLGFMNKKRVALFLYHETTKKITKISEDLMAVNQFLYDEQGKRLLFVGATYETICPFSQGIYEYSLETGDVRELLNPDTYALLDIRLMNDQILFLGSEGKRYGINENSWFYVLNQAGKVEVICENDDSLGSSVGSDCRYGEGDSFHVYGDRFYYLTTQYGNSYVDAIDLQGNKERIVAYNGSVDCFDIKDDRIVFVGMKDHHLQEVYEMKFDDQQIKVISSENTKVLRGYYVAEPKEHRFMNDGVELQGWVLLPRNYDASKKYPAILDIHGGPKTVYGEVFYHEMQTWANEGYFVFFMNPRGSDGRGNDFMDIFGKYGTCDYDDLMQFTDLVLKEYPQIDTKRVGVTGGSYGGFMTNWIIGHTDRFQAAASQRSISNWISFEHTSDIGPDFTKDQIHASTWGDLEKLWFHSPLKYANQVKTPTLFIHSNEDYRCPLSEGQQMVSALMEHHVPARLVMFKGENHELSRSGKPLHRLRRLNEITDWMNHYLK